MKYNIYENGGSVDGSISLEGRTVNGPVEVKGFPSDSREAATRGYVDEVAANITAVNVTNGVFNPIVFPNFNGDVLPTSPKGTLTLTPTGVEEGLYTKITVDAKGRVTAGTNVTAADITEVDWSRVSDKPTTLGGYGITDAVSRMTPAVTGDLSLPVPTRPNQLVPRNYVINKLASNTGRPTGTLVELPTDIAPTGYLQANGIPIDRNTNQTLADAIGDKFKPRHIYGGKAWINREYIGDHQAPTNTSLTLTPVLDAPSIAPNSGSFASVRNTVFFSNLNLIYTTLTPLDGASYQLLSTLPVEVTTVSFIEGENCLYAICTTSGLCFRIDFNITGNPLPATPVENIPLHAPDGALFKLDDYLYYLPGYSKSVYRSRAALTGELSPWVQVTMLDIPNPIGGYSTVVHGDVVRFYGGHSLLNELYEPNTHMAYFELTPENTFNSGVSDVVSPLGLTGATAITFHDQVVFVGGTNLHPNTPPNEVINFTPITQVRKYKIDGAGKLFSQIDLTPIEDELYFPPVLIHGTELIIGGNVAESWMQVTTDFGLTSINETPWLGTATDQWSASEVFIPKLLPIVDETDTYDLKYYIKL